MLRKQTIPIPLVEGVETKIDENQKTIGSIRILENVEFEDPGKYVKRTGYDCISVDILGSSSITDPRKITTYKNELCVANDTNLYSYSDSTNKWTNKGTISNIFPTSTPIVRNNYQQYNLASGHKNDIQVYAWQDTRGGIRITMIDAATENELISDVEITASGTVPSIEITEATCYIFFIDGSSIKFRKIDIANPTEIESEVTIINADLNAGNKIYDTCQVNNRVFIAYYSAAADLKYFYLLDDDTLSAGVTDAEAPSTALTLNPDYQGRIGVSFYNGTEVKCAVKNFSLSANIVPYNVVETVANITRTTMSTEDGTTYTVFYEQSAASASNHLIRSNTVTTASVIGTASVFKRSCGIIANAFTHDQKIYLPTIHASSLQSTIFILNKDSEVVSKISYSVSGGLLSTYKLSKVTSISTSKYLLTSQIKNRNISEDNTLFSLLGVNSTSLDFDNSVKYDNARLGTNLHFAGGIIQAYDGKEIVEHGFHIFPEGLVNSATATIGGNMSDGTYQYAAVYSWIDNKGNEHRSAPSEFLEVTLSGGTATQTVDIQIPTLRITEKSNAVIELYRSEANGTVLYKVTSTTSPVYNDTTIDTVTIQDTLADLTILSNELIYTTGGELDNIAAPAASIIETFQNRIILAGLENKNSIQYSKIQQPGKPVQFNDTLIQQVNSRGGDITAVAALDDKLIIFKETAIYYMSGDGPNNLGEQNTFIEPELISSDVGCKTQNSIVRIPSGIMFQSEKGIYLIDRSLNTTYIGAPVEDYNDLTIKSASFIPNKNQVRFLTDDQCLSYNYLVNKWVLFTNHQGISSTVLGNDYYYIRETNDIFKSATHFTDNGSPILIALETAWISAGGVQGFARIYRALILGEYKSPHKIKLKLAYNYLDAFTQESLIDTSDFTATTVYGGDSPYGSGSPYGGTGNQYQMRIDMKQQKCQSIKLRLEESQSDNYGEGLQLSNILLVVGNKWSEFKPDQTRVYGAS
jgi:hypothetical protein